MLGAVMSVRLHSKCVSPNIGMSRRAHQNRLEKIESLPPNSRMRGWLQTTPGEVESAVRIGPSQTDTAQAGAAQADAEPADVASARTGMTTAAPYAMVSLREEASRVPAQPRPARPTEEGVVSFPTMERSLSEDSYPQKEGSFWYENRSCGIDPICGACCSPADILWVFRRDGSDIPKKLWRCDNCIYTKTGYAAVQGYLKGSRSSERSSGWRQAHVRSPHW